jgi:hypothetical protein
MVSNVVKITTTKFKTNQKKKKTIIPNNINTTS